MQLVNTYWGSGNGNGNFDILIDDVKIASKKLQSENPNESFDVYYDIPENLLEGKQAVAVKLQAMPRSAITDPNNISLTVAIPSITPTQNYIFARIGVKLVGVEDWLFSPLQKISILTLNDFLFFRRGHTFYICSANVTIIQ